MSDKDAKISGRKTSREDVDDADADEDDEESAQRAKRRKQNVVVKEEPSQQIAPTVVLLEEEEEAVTTQNDFSSLDVVPDRQESSVAPRRVGLLKSGDDDNEGDDDDVMVVEPPTETIDALATSATGDDEIQLLGCKNQTRLPHLRQHCTEMPFVTLHQSRYLFATCEACYIPKHVHEDSKSNESVCDLCYCYVCDKPAKECQRWISTVHLTIYHNHCHATDNHASEWQTQRQLYKDNNLRRIAYLEDLAYDHVLIHAFSPDDPYAKPHFRALTKCCACGWYSKTRVMTTRYPAGYPGDWCQACGRIASKNSLQMKSGCVPYKPKPTDIFLGNKTVPFRIKVHDPRKMAMFKDNWTKLEGSPGWIYDEAAAEEEMFHHRFGTYPSFEMIMESISVLEEDKIPEDGLYDGWCNGWVKKKDDLDGEKDNKAEGWTYEEKDIKKAFDNDTVAIRVSDTDALLVDKNARALFQELWKFESIGFPPSKSKSLLVGGDIMAKWNKNERRGEFVVRVYFCKTGLVGKIGEVCNLPLLLGAWFDVFPFPLANLVGNIRATSRFRSAGSLYSRSAPPFFPTEDEIETLNKSAKTLMNEAVDNFNGVVESALGSFTLKSSTGDSSRLGGVCLSENSLPLLLKRYFTEKLPEHIKTQQQVARWVARASGISAYHRQMGSARQSSFSLNFRRLTFEQYVRDEDVPIASENLEKDCEIIDVNTKSNNALLLHLENLGHSEAPYVEGLNVELLPFQRQTLQWALDREKMAGGLQSFFWAKLPIVEDKEAPDLYFNPLLGKLTTSKPRLVRGGMVADEMGLGKTVVSLALILQNPAPLVPQSGSDSVLPNGGSDAATDGVGWDGDWQRREGENPIKASIISRGTLVVCHVSLVSQWIDEARSKLKDPGLVYAYHGQNRKRDALILATNSIIVTTYATLAKDATYHAGKAAKSGDNEYCPPCEQIRWWRIICDESHSLKQDTLQTKAVMSLVGDHKWAVSGTPWNTSILDLKNQLKFIGLEHVDSMFNEFQKTVVEPDQNYGSRRRRRPIYSSDRKIGHFMFFMRAVMIRHSQNQQYRGTTTTLMSLPPKSERSILIDFEPVEAEEYAKLEKKALDFYLLFKSQDRKDFSSHYLKLIQGLTPLRIACAGGRIPISEGANEEGKSDDPHEDTDEEPTIADGGDEPNEEPVKSKQNGKRKGRSVKPKRNGKSKSQEVDRLEENGKGKDKDEESVKPKKKKKVQVFSESSFQSKFSVLIAELERIRENEPDSKSLVFSQYISSLKFLQEELPKHGFQFRTLSGDMSLKQRAEALHAFQHDPPTTIFVLSMRAGAVGINLTQANRVFLLEPAMNPSLEAQAIGRVHRLGQTRNVEIVRLLMKDSIDTRICELVDKKFSRVRSVSTQEDTAGKDKDNAAMDEGLEQDATDKSKDNVGLEQDATDKSKDNVTDKGAEDAAGKDGHDEVEDATEKAIATEINNMPEENSDIDEEADDDSFSANDASAPVATLNTAIVGSMRTDKATLMGEEFDFLFGVKD